VPIATRRDESFMVLPAKDKAGPWVQTRGSDPLSRLRRRLYSVGSSPTPTGARGLGCLCYTVILPCQQRARQAERKRQFAERRRETGRVRSGTPASALAGGRRATGIVRPGRSRGARDTGQSPASRHARSAVSPAMNSRQQRSNIRSSSEGPASSGTPASYLESAVSRSGRHRGSPNPSRAHRPASLLQHKRLWAKA
jgi:hypothetical protein